MTVEIPVYVKPAKGETLWEMANEIHDFVQKEMKAGKGYKVFMIKPDQSVINVDTTSFDSIYASLFTQCCEGRF